MAPVLLDLRHCEGTSLRASGRSRALAVEEGFLFTHGLKDPTLALRTGEGSQEEGTVLEEADG